MKKAIWITILAFFLPSLVEFSSLWIDLEVLLGTLCTVILSLALYQKAHLASSLFPTNPVLYMWVPPREVSHPKAFHVALQMCVGKAGNRCQHLQIICQWSIQLMRPVFISASQWQKAQLKCCSTDAPLGLDVWRAWILLEAAEGLERCCQIFTMALAPKLEQGV